METILILAMLITPTEYQSTYNVCKEIEQLMPGLDLNDQVIVLSNTKKRKEK